MAAPIGGSVAFGYSNFFEQGRGSTSFGYSNAGADQLPVVIHPAPGRRPPPGQIKRYARLRFLTSIRYDHLQWRDDFILPKSIAGGSPGSPPAGGSRAKNLPLTGAG